VSADILLVSEVFPPAIGGSGALLENIYSRLAGRRVRVLSQLANPERSSQGRLDVTRIAMTAPDWGVVRPRSLARHLRVSRTLRTMLTEAPAAVHCARALPEGLSAVLALGRIGGPLVCWLHGEELGFASTSTELSWLARQVYGRATAVIANSMNSRNLLVQEWGVASSKVHVVYPGVDVARFTPTIDARETRAKVAGPEDILYVSIGRLQRRKGQDAVLRALARVRRAVPQARYAIVGDGPYRAELETLAAALDVADIVTFVGAASEAELPCWYKAADIFIMPNRCDGVDFEGFGIVFLEAAACGLPVIAGRSGGAPEAVVDGTTGTLVDGDDVEDVARAMISLALDADRRLSMGLTGARRAREEFTWNAAVARLESVLCTLR
jgi:phosphatidylinositol alpha-1,6-mannosyltransferase